MQSVLKYMYRSRSIDLQWSQQAVLVVGDNSHPSLEGGAFQ